MHLKALFFLLTIYVVTGPVSAQRTVAITIDDLPYAGKPQTLEAATHTADAMIAAMKRYGVPAAAFVTGVNVMVDGQIDARLDLLRRWRDGGVCLENHGFSHSSFNKLSLEAYQDDVMQGHLFPERLMREAGDSVRWYRHPFNHTGASEEKKAAFAGFLNARHLQLAPFTVEHADYIFNALYLDAQARGDTAAMKRIGTAYLAQLDTAFTFAEQLARETFGRDISQVFLIHANAINADYLGRMLERLQQRGYRFVSLDVATRDPAYATPDLYIKPWGVSWLHRWRVALELPNALRREPDPPKWVLEEYGER
jgi:peptidoglycan/xylan/chitin deacetylase (PgdA/CDA1 family)